MPDLRRCIQGALQHHMRDGVRLVRSPHRLHQQGECPLGRFRLDASADGEPCLPPKATALRLTFLEGLSLRAAAKGV